MKYFKTDTNNIPSEIDVLPEGMFLFRDGYRKIHEENEKFPTICFVFWDNKSKKKMYIPISEVAASVKLKYKEKFVELSHA